MSRYVLPLVLLAASVSLASAQPQPTQATFLITGLHCPPCTKTVETSLQRVPGVRAVSVDWRSKNAKVEFDESKLSAQELAQRIQATPHMMGRGMQYGGWLALRVEGVQEEPTAAAVRETLGNVPGVARVVVYPAQGSVGVLFDAKAKTTTSDLIDALKEAEIRASNLK